MWSLERNFSNKKGFTLAELLAAIIVTAIVVLMVGAIGNIAVKSYSDLRRKSGVYADSQFALQFIRESVRQSTSTPTVVSSTTLANNSLQIVTPNCANLFFYMQGSTLVYDSTCGAITKTATPIITGITNFTPCNNLSPNPPCLPVAGQPITGQMISVTLIGSNPTYNLNFNYSTSNTRRNP